jgi:hypothetical protein
VRDVISLLQIISKFESKIHLPLIADSDIMSGLNSRLIDGHMRKKWYIVTVGFKGKPVPASKFVVKQL